MSDQANTDPLTGLINRRYFMEILNDLLKQPNHGNRLGTLLFLDLDNFKPVNDQLGHDAGDIALQVIAERLRNLLREQDYVARLGGDEFVLLFTGDSSNNLDSETVAQRVEANIAAPIMVKKKKINLGCSIGTTQLKKGDDPQEVLNRADKAMYAVKFARRHKTTTM
ncbi:GGDEF domain-containing protein [Desulfurivibrio alkaliphilus]|uniref:GGDEF domain-containing protein n=1 Tax=Desulfurivibrio alkaliphilus TaxID=427923 RepID=UPI0001B3EDA2|nr:GGDEF domain-containing protein [Desulfurivibrio alkaliphilus]